MPNTNPQFITRFEVSLQDIPEQELDVVFGILDTLDFEIGETRSVFWYANQLRDFLRAKFTGDLMLDAVHRSILTYLNSEVIKEMLGQAKNYRKRALELQTSKLPKVDPASVEQVYEDGLLLSLHLTPAEVPDLKKEVVHILATENPEATKKLKELSVFANYLRTVCFALGLDLSLDRYDKDQCFGILGGVIQEFDEGVLLLSLKELFDYHDGIEFVQRILPTNLLNITLDQSFSWYEALIRTILLHITWNVFNLLQPFDQADLMRRLFVISAYSGVPVEHFAAEYVYQTNSMGAYVAAHQTLQTSLDLNIEVIPAVGTVPAVKFKEILDEWYGAWQPTEIIPESAIAFVSKKYSDFFPNQQENLAEAFITYGKIGQALLTETNQGGEAAEEAEVNKIALAQLLFWFADEQAWTQIIAYYQKEPTISPKQFFRYLAENFPLEKDEGAVDKVMKFVETLAVAKIISADFAPIIFDETTEEFVWDQDALIE